MGLIGGLLTLPLAPLRGVMWVADKVKDEAERQWYDPASIQQEMLEVERLRETGQMSEADADALEEALLQRLLEGSGAQGGLDVSAGACLATLLYSRHEDCWLQGGSMESPVNFAASCNRRRKSGELELDCAPRVAVRSTNH